MSIARRPDGRWRARYHGPDGKEHARHFDTKREGQRWLATVDVAVNRGEWTDPARATVTLGEWIERAWLPAQSHLKASTRARYEGLTRKHIVPRFGKVKLSAMSHSAVQAWVSDLIGAELAASTVRQAHRVLSLQLASAVKDNRIARNAADGVKLPRARQAPKRFLTHHQVALLADGCGRYRTAVLTLAYSGLRFGELAALRVRDVDLLRRRVAVERAVAEVGGRFVLGSPKSHHLRTVPLPAFLVDELAPELAGRGPDELAFPAPMGGMLRNLTFRRGWFDRAADEIGLAGLTPHELRHTAASLAVSAGATVKAVQRILGHASAAMTLDVYAGLFADDLDAVADRMHAAKLASDSDQARTGEIIRLPRTASD